MAKEVAAPARFVDRLRRRRGWSVLRLRFLWFLCLKNLEHSTHRPVRLMPGFIIQSTTTPDQLNRGQNLCDRRTSGDDPAHHQIIDVTYHGADLYRRRWAYACVAYGSASLCHVTPL